MIKIENGKPRIIYGNMKIIIPQLEKLFKEEIARVNARCSKIEKRLIHRGVE